PAQDLGKKHNNHRLFRCNFSQDLLAPSTHATELRHRCARPGYLRWVFGEAAVIAKRDHTVIGPLAQRLEAKMNGDTFKAINVYIRRQTSHESGKILPGIWNF
ncbi:MAG: hypothetical protein ABSF10_22780, partial [Verrucomicrobiota bacterium]